MIEQLILRPFAGVWIDYYPLMASSYFKLSAFYGGIVELLYALDMMLAALLMSMFGMMGGNN